MCEGIAHRLKTDGLNRVLCLGDGIGDLALTCHNAGLEPVYHDLAGSRTAEYAMFRFWRQTGDYMTRHTSQDWTVPEFAPFGAGLYDAIVSLDFLEHVINVEEWARAIFAALRPGGLFFAQNAFAIGSGPDGPMPMHLKSNDRFEHDWLPLLGSLAFEQIGDTNWYRKP
jgi:2-polyprenyl-3-methyl-5-hydroxy-6-metoxy-1,4-benzoquinol methylase